MVSFYYFASVLAGLAAGVKSQTFTNPIIWEDLPDNDVSRVGDAFYMSASSFHLSPGAPILRSYDLVNWEHVGNSVPTLDFGSAYDMADNKTAYVKGIWASTLRYRESDGVWYFLACVGFAKSYVLAADDVTGPWKYHAELDRCYYDAGLLFDQDGSVYVAYGNTEISVAELSSDLKSETSNKVVFNTPTEVGTLEGSRMYKRDGNYYIFLTRPPDAQYIVKSSSPWGPFQLEVLVDRIALTAVPGAGSPHQGSLVDTSQGDWYYMGFTDIYPGGRAPVLAPITWNDDGFPQLVTVNGEWGDYPYPLPKVEVPDSLGIDEFSGSSLKPDWQWNHNPDTTGFSVDNGLTLRTVTVTDDLYHARNTLSRRIRGPIGTGTLHLDFSGMADGDRAGLAAFRDKSGMIGIERDGDEWSLVVSTRDLNDGFDTSGESKVLTKKTGISFREVYLRLEADIRPSVAGSGVFSYSTDGETFTELASFQFTKNWTFFLGYRYGIYNYATKGLGGKVLVTSFESA
ncbi:xylosidase glycosyl [Fusarium albosuccineum]|uniref:Xylosidase glycosyl n=1 Tax=Fusarium albosuccineum TaxID=1237068 RepID=A0A8H4LD91_9HYPO|nr:xylosidase glycosyl [Fusarium albosuccineum]